MAILKPDKNGNLDHNYDGHTIKNKLADKIEELRFKSIMAGNKPTKVYMHPEDFEMLVRSGIYRNFKDIDEEGNVRGWNDDFQFEHQEINGKDIGPWKYRMWRGLEVLDGVLRVE